MIFTFWEGEMPEYIALCMQTWKFDYVILNYDNLSKYTDAQVTDKLKKFTLPKIADYVRCHVLRDNGGYWLDADTIMITDKLPTTNMIGNPDTRSNTIGYLHADKPHEQFFNQWAYYQDIVVANEDYDKGWDIMGNRFTDQYVKYHPEVTICDVTKCWAETYMVDDLTSRYDKYRHFYFKENYHLKDLQPTDMLMLHNSWTPGWYKELVSNEVLEYDCTLSNILKEILE